jgi:hypothetical protein
MGWISTRSATKGSLSPPEGFETQVDAAERRHAHASLPAGLGWAGPLTVVVAAGLFVSAIAANLARQEQGATAGALATACYWSGIALVTIPVGLRLLRQRVTRRERVLLLVAVAVGLYLIKLLHDPLMFTFYDEFLHVRSVDDILRSGRLFTPSSLLPVSPSFPGLESVTSAAVSMSGAPVFVAGAIVLGVARVLLVLALYLFYCGMGATQRVAGIATFIYMANPNFLFFTAQFAYESLALPLAIFTLYVVARHQFHVDRPLPSWIFMALAILATVQTHHVTSIALFAFLALWTIVAIVVRRRTRKLEAPVAATLMTGLTTYVWLIAVAGIVVGYLSPAIRAAAGQIVDLVRGGSTRELFAATGAPRLPGGEQVLAYVSIGITLAAILWGVWRLRTRGNVTAPTIALVLGALGYPLSLLGRFTEQGASLSDRASAFLFVAVGFVVADAMSTGGESKDAPVRFRWLASLANAARHRLGSAAQAAALVLIMLGGVALAFPVWARLPGSYLVAADPRSIEPEGIDAAEWTIAYLGPGNRFVVDRTNRLLVGTIGQQHAVTASLDRIRVRNVLFSLQFGPEEAKLLADGDIDYVLVDRRLSSSLPLVGVYYERGEISGGRHATPLDPAALAKFDGVPQISRIFDGGDIQIYDVRLISDGTNATP